MPKANNKKVSPLQAQAYTYLHTSKEEVSKAEELYFAILEDLDSGRVAKLHKLLDWVHSQGYQCGTFDEDYAQEQSRYD